MQLAWFCLRLIISGPLLISPLPPRPPRRRKFLGRYFPSRCDLASATGDLRRSRIPRHSVLIQVVVRLNQTRARPRHNSIELEEQTHTFDEWINHSAIQPRTIGWYPPAASTRLALRLTPIHDHRPSTVTVKVSSSSTALPSHLKVM